MATPTLYHFSLSPHSRLALWVFRYLNVNVNVEILNLREKEQLKPEFLKINPQHCVPTLKDGDFVLWEARAIATYICNSRAPNNPLYPSDPKLRGTVDHRLYFDVTTLYKRARDIFFPIMFLGATEIPEDKKELLVEALVILNGFLDGNKYVAGGDNVTLADLSIMVSMSSLINAGLDISAYPNIGAWYERNKSLPGFEENEKGAILWGERVKAGGYKGKIL